MPQSKKQTEEKMSGFSKMMVPKRQQSPSPGLDVEPPEQGTSDSSNLIQASIEDDSARNEQSTSPMRTNVVKINLAS